MGLLRLDAFHCALLVAIVLLAVYVARGYGLFKERFPGGSANQPHGSPRRPGECGGSTCL